MADLKLVNENNFQAEVISSSKVTVVDFFAPWCSPCRKMGEVLSLIADEHSEINVFKLNTDDNLNLSQEYAISSVPTVLIFKDGKAVERLVGLMPKSALIKNIEKYL